MTTKMDVRVPTLDPCPQINVIIKGAGSPGKDGAQGPQGEPGPQGPQGEKGEQGESGITVPISGFFSLGVESGGGLYAYYTEGSDPPEFEYNSDTGELYYLTPDE